MCMYAQYLVSIMERAGHVMHRHKVALVSFSFLSMKVCVDASDADRHYRVYTCVAVLIFCFENWGTLNRIHSFRYKIFAWCLWCTGLGYTVYMYVKFSRLGIQVSLAIYVCLSGLWLGGLLYLSFLSTFL